MNNKLTNKELLEKFEVIIKELERKADANTSGESILYKFAISDARERLEQLKLGMY